MAGWHEFLDRLDDHLEGEHPASEERVRQWEALKPRYLNQLERELRG